MTLTLLTGPAAMPLDLDDVKAHLRLDGTDEDALLTSLVATSVSHVEAALGLALITQSWRWQGDCWPKRAVVDLRLRPVQTITSVTVRDADGGAAAVDAADYTFDAATGRLAPRHGWPAPGLALGGIEIDFVAGFGAAGSAVPEPIRHALRLLVAHWYEVRNPVHIGTMAARVPDTVSDLLRPFKGHRL